MKLHGLYLSISLLLALDTNSAFAQIDADFGVINTTEAELTECAFDSGAAAVVLVDKALTDHQGDLYGLMTFRHTRIKILKQESIDDMNFKIRFRSADDLENVDNIKAVVINFDKDKKKIITKIEPNTIYRRKVSATDSEIAFAFPNLQVGSIVEYSYRFTAQHYGRLRNWSFQDYYPVYKSSYDLHMVPHLEMSYAVQKSPAFSIIVKPSKATNSVYFEMQNLPGLHDEPFMASRTDNLQRVTFEVSKLTGQVGTEHWMSSWDEVIKHLYAREDFGSQIKMKIGDCDDYVRTDLAGKADFEKMNLVYNYVRKNVKWNHTYHVISKDGIRDAWSKKTGSSGSVNLLLINMLRTAGLDAAPMLVSERGFGRINKVKPLINQFNSVYAAVNIGGKTYYLDATDEYNPVYLTPFSILHTTAFIADFKTGGLRDIEAPDEYKYKDIITVQATLGNDNSLTGSVNIKSFDYAKNIKTHRYSQDKSGYAETHYGKPFNVIITGFKVEDQTKETDPFVESFNFKGGAEETDSYLLVPMDIFAGLRSDAFLNEKRFSEVDFGHKKTIILNYVISLPPNKTAGELAKNIQLVNADKSLIFSRNVSYLENTHQVAIRLKFEQNKGYYSVQEYSDLREFFKKMNNMLEEQCVIKNK